MYVYLEYHARATVVDVIKCRYVIALLANDIIQPQRYYIIPVAVSMIYILQCTLIS